MNRIACRPVAAMTGCAGRDSHPARVSRFDLVDAGVCPLFGLAVNLIEEPGNFEAALRTLLQAGNSTDTGP
jgi:hypothetical protein